MYVYILCVYIYKSYIYIHIISFHRHGVAGHDCHVLRRLAWSHRGREGAAVRPCGRAGQQLGEIIMVYWPLYMDIT